MDTSTRGNEAITAAHDEHDASAELMLLLNQLAAMPLPQWHDLAVASPGTVAGELQLALDRALQVATTPFAVWEARDHLDTLMHRFDRAEGHGLHRTSQAPVHVRQATERAILAVLARSALGEADFARLVGTFASLVR